MSEANDIKTEKERFNYLLQSLGIEQLEKIKKVIEDSQKPFSSDDNSPTESKPYTTAKNVLLQYYNNSEEKRLRKLFENSDDTTASKSPSEILEIIQKRAGTAVSEKAVKEL